MQIEREKKTYNTIIAESVTWAVPKLLPLVKTRFRLDSLQIVLKIQCIFVFFITSIY